MPNDKLEPNWEYYYQNNNTWYPIHVDSVKGTVTHIHSKGCDPDVHRWSVFSKEFKVRKLVKEQDREFKVRKLVKDTKLTGGPASYYDLPYSQWTTTNDMGEFLAKERWKEYSLHFKDLLKALVRFGVKDGTSMQYDTEKIIYSGCRVMIMLLGKQALRDYLIKLLDDPQFKTEETK